MISSFRSEKSLKIRRILGHRKSTIFACFVFGAQNSKNFVSFRHAESNPPPVLAAFISASYLCLIQDSSTAFTLTSHEMAVSPFLLISISLCIIFIYQKTFRFCSRVKSLNIVPRDTVVLYDGWSFLSLTCESQETGSCSSACPLNIIKLNIYKF